MSPADVADLADLTVVVPTRNAERLIDGCLASVVANRPGEVIVVDGCSTDRTVEIARRYPVRIISDGGRGVAAARQLGAEAAGTRYVTLVDADVVLPDGALAAILEEFREGGYTGLQAALESVSGGGYWGRALAHHHRSGRSKDWFGVVATVFERDVLLRAGLDAKFLSGEDIELRWRLERAGGRVGVSRRTAVTHRFAGDDFAFARDQWLADGAGLARMVGKHGWRAAWLLALPAAAAARGIGLSLVRGTPGWVPYYVGFAGGNYAGMVGVAARRLRPRPPGAPGAGPRRLSMPASALGLVAGKGANLALGFAFWLAAARVAVPEDVGVAAGVIAAMMLCVQVAMLGVGPAVIARAGCHLRADLLDTALTLVVVAAAAASLGYLALGALALDALDLAAAAGPAGALVFVALAVTGTVVLVLDHVAMADGRGDQVVARNLVSGSVTLAPLAAVAVTGGRLGPLALLALWAAGGAAALAVAARQLGGGEGGYRFRPRLPREVAGALVRAGLPNQALTLAERAPALALPVVIAEVVSPEANAYWYTAWMTAWAVNVVPLAVGTALFAEVAREPGTLEVAARRCLRWSLGVGAALAVPLAALAAPVLSLLGPAYAEQGAEPLRLLLAGLVPAAFLQTYFGACRARARLGEAIATAAVAGGAGLAAASMAARTSLAAAALAWVGAQAVAGLWSRARLARVTATRGAGPRVVGAV